MIEQPAPRGRKRRFGVVPKNFTLPEIIASYLNAMQAGLRSEYISLLISRDSQFRQAVGETNATQLEEAILERKTERDRRYQQAIQDLQQ